ncbi:MAG: cadmium-translocating P-type ATPase [Oscillospiraceae bacterium]|nr:cadmium-translocating P-type ATPase [Oscillospiraceae bacterium]
MPRKVYSIENLDCANCAAKAEAKIRQIPGVEEASITFATMQLRVAAENPDALLPQILAAAQSVEPDIRFLPRKEHHHEAHHYEHHDACCAQEQGHCHPEYCGCSHDHEYEAAHRGNEEHHHAHNGSELTRILIGTGLFAAGILLEWLLPALPLHFIAFIAAYLILGWHVLLTAGKNIVRGKVFDENFLMGLATLGAFAIGEFAEAVGVMLFYRIGEYFEHRAMERSRSQIMEAVDLRPEVVTLISGQTIPAEEAKAGDLLLVRPGDRIPLDGVVVSGESRIDTAPITGEPVPVGVKPGDSVTSGCVNTDGLLTVRAEKPLSESMVTRILNSVENAAASKPKIDRFITRFARVYTPAVVIIAVLTALVPSLVWGDWNYWVYTALSFLVMSCPCALVLSVPLAFFSGIGAGSKKGILFKGGVSIETLAQVKAVVMDKTGTITKGDFSLQKAVGDGEILALCAACEQHSTHPIAQSIVTAAREQGLTLAQPEQVEEISGHGIHAMLNGREILCGNETLLARFGVNAEGAAAEDYGTQILVAADGKLLGYLLIADTVKPGAREAIVRLKRQGVVTAMLTGDHERSAQAVSAAVGIDETHAGLLPEQKLERLGDIRSRKGAAMFVGDGINDAPVLAGADVGAAMGTGADAAIEAADVVFMTSGVDAIPEALDIARKTQRVAWQNVVLALAVKALVMVLGLLGCASMWAAVFADSGVAMLCVLNSIRMLYRKK